MIHTHNIQHKGLVGRSPFYYGWVVWAVATLGTMATAPAQSFTVSLFIDHFIRDFGLDRTTVSALFAVGTFLAALSLTWVGKQIDHRGSRMIGVVVVILYALSLMAFSLVTGPFMLFFGFVAIRGLGQGALALVNNTVLAQWFVRRRGRVMSLVLVTFALFQSQYVPALQQLIEKHGWHLAWIVLGVGVLVISLPATWFLLRDHPEDFGLLPDGEHPVADGDKPTSLRPEDNWTLHEAMRTPIFWIFVAGRFISPAWGSSLVFHQISLFASLGYDSHTAAQTFGHVSLVTAGMILVSGWLMDHIRPGYVFAFQLAMLSLTMFMAMVMTQPLLLLVYTVSYGFAAGNGMVFDATAWANLFGRLHLGAIRGFVVTVLVAGTAVGPVIFGLSYDIFGSYNPVLMLGIVLALVPMTLSLFVNKPRHRLHTQPAEIRG